MLPKAGDLSISQLCSGERPEAPTAGVAPKLSYVLRKEFAQYLGMGRGAGEAAAGWKEYLENSTNQLRKWVKGLRKAEFLLINPVSPLNTTQPLKDPANSGSILRRIRLPTPSPHFCSSTQLLHLLWTCPLLSIQRLLAGIGREGGSRAETGVEGAHILLGC